MSDLGKPENERLAVLEQRVKVLEEHDERRRLILHDHANRIHVVTNTVEVLQTSVRAIQDELAQIRGALVDVLTRLGKVEWRTTGAVGLVVLVIEAVFAVVHKFW